MRTRSAVFSLDLGSVRVRKVYELHVKTAPDLGYELTVRHEFEAKIVATKGAAPHPNPHPEGEGAKA